MSLKLRQAKIDDIQQVFNWRNDPWIVSLSSSQSQVNWEEHIEWYQNVLTSDQALFLIIEPEPNISAGVVRLDRINEYQAKIAIYLLKRFTGQGIGVSAILSACLHGFISWSIQTIHAYIRNENHSSISAFTKAGFLMDDSSINCPNGHCEMFLNRPQGDILNKDISKPKRIFQNLQKQDSSTIIELTEPLGHY